MCEVDWTLCFTDQLLSSSAVLLELPESLAITGGYAQQYRAVQLHLHWGSPSGPGSEHTVNRHRFAAEVRSPHGSGYILSSPGAGQGRCWSAVLLLAHGPGCHWMNAVTPGQGPCSPGSSAAAAEFSTGGHALVLSQTHAAACGAEGRRTPPSALRWAGIGHV